MEILQTEESVKLYEYDQSKPDLDEEILEHFGILGMRWGKRNGPPYPLGSNISTGKRLKKVLGGGGGSGSSGSTSRKRKKLRQCLETLICLVARKLSLCLID